jgi:hypothetical protein
VSERSIKRANERRLAKERRREMLMRRRAGWAVGAAAGATVLLAPVAHADTFVVQTTEDGEVAECTTDGGGVRGNADLTYECETLRDAVAAANENQEPDTIRFADGVTGTIRLTEGRDLDINTRYDNDLAIVGPGAGALSISGDAADDGEGIDDVRIFDISGDNDNDVRIEGLTLTEGGGASESYDPGKSARRGGGGYTPYSGDGGAIRLEDGRLTVVDSTITGNRTVDGDDGGALYVGDGSEAHIERAAITGNTSSSDGGAIFTDEDEDTELTVRDSEISGNTAGDGGGGIFSASRLDVDESNVSENTADDLGGGVFLATKYGFEISDSTITGNEADVGGGIALPYAGGKYPGATETIANTTVSGNTGREEAGGILVGLLFAGAEMVVQDSTISGNDTAGAGGGILFGYVGGDFDLLQSTVSGNTANEGGGLSFGGEFEDYADRRRAFGRNGDRGRGFGFGGVSGDFNIANSTIARNSAVARGGGIYLGSYESYDSSEKNRGDEESTYLAPTVPLTSTIVADNGPQDVDRDDKAEGGGLDIAFSLVEAPGDAPLFQGAGEYNIIGQDPQLGALGNNGGPTQTHVPARTSPVIDRGNAAPRLPFDQRDEKRTIDTFAANAPGGDATDIGSTESPTGPDAPPAGAAPAPPQPGPGTPFVFTRVKPTGMTVNLTPKTDLEAPFRFRVSGRITPPSPLTPAQACASIGIVNVQVKAGKKTISSRRVAVRPDCTYSVNVAFKGTDRFGKSRRLKFTARFLGNAVLEPIFPRSVLGRVREADGGGSSARRR